MLLSLLLIPYAVLVIIFLIFAVVSVAHLIVYGATSRGAYLMTMFFIVGIIAVLGGTALLLHGVDWSAPLTIQSRAADLIIQ